MSVPYHILIDEFKNKSIGNETIKVVNENTTHNVYRKISTHVYHFNLNGSINIHLPANRGFDKKSVEFNYYFPNGFDLHFYSRLFFYFEKINPDALCMDLLFVDKSNSVRHIEQISVSKSKFILDFDKSYKKDISLGFDPSRTQYMIFKIYEVNGKEVDFGIKLINTINFNTL